MASLVERGRKFAVYFIVRASEHETGDGQHPKKNTMLAREVCLPCLRGAEKLLPARNLVPHLLFQ